MSQRQRSLRLTLVFERLSKRRRAARQEARKTRSAEELAERQQDLVQPEPAAKDEAETKD